MSPHVPEIPDGEDVRRLRREMHPCALHAEFRPRPTGPGTGTNRVKVPGHPEFEGFLRAFPKDGS